VPRRARQKAEWKERIDDGEGEMEKWEFLQKI
jgi:hypothetical protein